MRINLPITKIPLTISISRWLGLGGALAFMLAGAPWVAHGAACNYSVSAPPGLSMIANQCDAAGGNTLNNVLPGVPNGSQIIKWNNTTQTWDPVATFNGASWSPNTTLVPGSGAFFFNPTASAITLNFSGNPHTPVLPLNVPANGYCIVSRQVPLPATYDDIIGQPPQGGDRVYRYFPSQGSYVCYMFDEFDLAWTPVPPMANIGESVWICRGSGGTVPTTPCHPDTTPPVIDCACLRDLTHNLLLTNACRGFIPNLCQFTNCFRDDCCLLSCSQSPAAGTPVSPGIYPIIITLTDCANNKTANCTLDFVVHEPAGCRTNWDCGMTVVTCYSDSKANATTDQCSNTGTSDPNGFVVAIFDTRLPLPPPNPPSGKLWTAAQSSGYHNELGAPIHQFRRSNLGEVFGITLDDATPANIYVAATSLYPGDAYASGGPGGVYKIDGVTLNISLCISFPNVGSVSLGDVCHDPVHQQLFVADLDNGLIRRVALPGCVEQNPPFDHGLSVSPAVPNVITAPGDLTPPGRRVFAVQFYNGRIYYSLYTKNPAPGCGNFSQIWSIGLTPSGAFVPASATEPRLEHQVPAPICNGFGGNSPVWVTDIAFSPTGEMLLAERDVCGEGAFQVNLASAAHHARVWKLQWNGLIWVQSGPNPRLVGCGFGYNSAGGVDFTCDEGILAMGDALAAPQGAPCALMAPDSPGAYVYGIQYNPPGTTGKGNAFLIDLNNNTTSYDKNFLGDVEHFRCCNCCAKITSKPVECVDTNMAYKWDFCITNCWTNAIRYLSILDLPPGVTPSEDILTLQPALSPGQGTCLTLYLTNKSGLTNLCFTVGVHSTNFAVCCSVTNCLALPSCCVWISGDSATPVTGQPNCYIYNPGVIKNVSSTPLKYLFLVPQPDAPNNCFSFSPNVITFNPLLLPNQTATLAQRFPQTLKLTVNPGCPKPLSYLAAAHDSNLVQCCFVRHNITQVKSPVDFPPGFDGSVFPAGSNIGVPVVIDGSVVRAKRVTLYEGTNALRTIVDPTDGQHDDYFVLSNATARAYVFTWKLTDNLDAVWPSDPATVYVVGPLVPIPPPAPAFAAAALNRGNIAFSLPTLPGVTCHVEYKESLDSPTWLLLRSIDGDGSVVTVTDSITNAPQRFYRVRMP